MNRTIMPRMARETTRAVMDEWKTRSVSFMAGLKRAWVSIEVPGTGSDRRLTATYVKYERTELPEAPTGLGKTWDWLRAAERHTDSYLAKAYEYAVQDLTEQGVMALVARVERLPSDFASFIREVDLRERLRTATDCHFDLGNHLVSVDGGQLLHFLSDSQWVRHWLLFLGDDGSSCIVTTGYPAGFDLGPDDLESWEGEPWEYVACADSFSEFLWRWWMDNEVFYRVAVDHHTLSDQQVSYVRRFGEPSVIE